LPFKIWKIKAGWMIKVEKEVNQVSFRCQGECRRCQPPGSQPNRVVTLRRRVTYQRVREGKVIQESRGLETVQERDMCRSCADAAPPPTVVPGPTTKYAVTMVAKA